MSKAEIINYQSKDIFFASHRGSEEEDVIKVQEQLVNMINDKGGKNILMLIDMTDVIITPELHKKMKNLGKATTPILKKVAMIGMSSGIKSVIIKGAIKFTGQNMKLFDTIEEAKEWLVED